MPASMIMPPDGSILKVSGSSIAMVAAGPSPGMMPTIVPSKQPTKHQNTFAGCRATANPCRSPSAMSISEPEQADGKRNVQQDWKREMECQRSHDGSDGGRHWRTAEDDGHNEEREQGKTDEKTERLHERNRNRKGEPGDERAAGGTPIDAVALA